MLRQRFMILPAVLLLAGLAALPACKKNKPDEGGGGGGGGGGDERTPGQVPAAVSSEYLLFAHLRAKDIRESPVVAEIKQAFAKAGGADEWDEFEQQATKEIGLGIKPTEIDSVTACVPEFPAGGGLPSFILILTTSKPIDKAGVFGLGPQAKPDARGFYTGHAPGQLHFPDDKTLVILSPNLADKYLGGYAKSRTGWPMTAELTRAASGHTLFAAVQMDKFPRQMLGQGEAREFGSLLAARAVTLTADLKGKELGVAVRAAFPDAAAAGKAKETVQKFIGMAAGFVEQAMSGKGDTELAALGPAVKEAHRALKEARVEVSGSDLTVAGSYKANFDIGAMVADAVPKIRAAAGRTKAQNNLKQIALALINYSDTYGGTPPIHAVGAKGVPLKNPNDKPLLSWRVAILPYIEQQNLYSEFKLDEPWDSENNKKLIEKMPKVYAPAKPGKPGYTHMQMVVGPSAMRPTGMKFPASFQDGTSNTIAVVEAAEPVIWTKPDDVMLPGKDLPKDFRKKFGGLFPNGFNVAMWDGSVRFVRDTTSDRTLSLLINPADGQLIPNDW